MKACWLIWYLVFVVWGVTASTLNDSTVDVLLRSSWVSNVQRVSRVKRIVTKSYSKTSSSRDRTGISASVERASDLRAHLISLLFLLHENGGFSSAAKPENRNAIWNEHDIRLANHLVATFYHLKNNGFRPIRTNKMLPLKDEDRLISFMATCFVLFNQNSEIFPLLGKGKKPSKRLTPEEEEDYLRDLTALFFVLSSGGDVFKLILPPFQNDISQQRQLAADYALLLSQADGPKLPFKGCGENREKDGTSSTDWPWMVALLSIQNNFLRLFCGAVLINEWFVLTAAHCLNDKSPSEVIVRLGEHNFRLPNTWRRNHRVERMILHEKFDPKTYDHDIALIKLKEKAVIRDNVGHIWPICLPPANLELDNKDAYIAGWGKTSQGGSPSEELLDAGLPVWRRDECERLFQLRRDPINYNFQFCAGPKDGSADACDGDSGGPLMYKMPSGRWGVIGIVSWGIDGKCAVPGEPGVYTRVTAYTDWIYNRIAI